MADYIVNQVSIDWLTLTTWHESAYSNLRDFVRSKQSESKPQRRLQYRGVVFGDGLFFGEGEQSGSINYMVQASGAAAHWLMLAMLTEAYDLRPLSFHPTRLDIQLTLLIPDYKLAGWEWVARGEGRRVQHITQDGLDTVYIGSRSGDKFLRIYVKEDMYDNMGKFSGQMIRWEYELKGEHASGIWVKILTDKPITGLWAHLYNVTMNGSKGSKAWDEVVCPTLASAFKDIPAVGYTMPAKESNTMLWLSTAVTSSIIRMLNDHDKRHHMCKLLDQWYREAGESGALERYTI
jgi:hypothetical protein